MDNVGALAGLAFGLRFRFWILGLGLRDLRFLFKSPFWVGDSSHYFRFPECYSARHWPGSSKL